MQSNKDNLDEVIQMFMAYKSMSEKAILDLSDSQLDFQLDNYSNSIKIIMLHMAGNLKSRWTNFLIEDGEKLWRKRDDEFETSALTKVELLDLWNSGWECLFDSLNNLNEEDFGKTVFIRQEPHSVWKAIHRQLAHYAYHTGQIVMIAKHLLKNEWKTLSIPKKS